MIPAPAEGGGRVVSPTHTQHATCSFDPVEEIPDMTCVSRSYVFLLECVSMEEVL